MKEQVEEEIMISKDVEENVSKDMKIIEEISINELKYIESDMNHVNKVMEEKIFELSLDLAKGKKVKEEIEERESSELIKELDDISSSLA